MEGLNRVYLAGSLGADPELRFTQGGQAILNIRMATTESYLDKDKVRKERTDWHNVSVWGKRGEALAKILEKGSNIIVEGRISNTSYEDKEGNKRYKSEVVANNIILAGRGGDRSSRGGGDGKSSGGRGNGVGFSGRRPASAGGNEPPDDMGYGGGSDDIPFMRRTEDVEL